MPFKIIFSYVDHIIMSPSVGGNRDCKVAIMLKILNPFSVASLSYTHPKNYQETKGLIK